MKISQTAKQACNTLGKPYSTQTPIFENLHMLCQHWGAKCVSYRDINTMYTLGFRVVFTYVCTWTNVCTYVHIHSKVAQPPLLLESCSEREKVQKGSSCSAAGSILVAGWPTERNDPSVDKVNRHAPYTTTEH